MTQAREQGTSPLGKAVCRAGTPTTARIYILPAMSLMPLAWDNHRDI